MTAVLYRPLPGETLRQISNKDGFDWQSNLDPLVALIRRLHGAGIYFRPCTWAISLSHRITKWG